MILWYLDRFKLPPGYASKLSRLLTSAKIRPTTVRFTSLHTRMRGSLLTNYGSRTAPTWEPLREGEIVNQMMVDLQEHNPDVVVLTSPESLCRVGLPPEHCTLLKLRGSVYVVDGIPHLVMLPMSAYNKHVSPKDTGGANYGIEEMDDFEAALNATPIDEKRVGNESAVDETLLPEAEDEEDSEEHPSALKDKYDTFWYEPVLAPVGKFAIESDVAKLGRIYERRKSIDANAE